MPMESYRRRLMIVTIPSTRIIDVPVHTSLYRIVPPVRIYKIRLPINTNYIFVPMGPGRTFVIDVVGRVHGLISNIPSINHHPLREHPSVIIVTIHPLCSLRMLLPPVLPAYEVDKEDEWSLLLLTDVPVVDDD